MVEPKMSLTLILPGSTMVSQQVAENKPKKFTKKDEVKVLNCKSKKLETISFKVRECIPAVQVLNISNIAYESMLKIPSSAKYSKIIEVIKKKPIRIWDKLSENERISKHCEFIAHDMNAISFNFTVFED